MHNTGKSLDSCQTDFPNGKRPPKNYEEFHSLSSDKTAGPESRGAFHHDAKQAEADSSARLGRINEYELIEKLGSGSFGVVYKARNLDTGVEVALKTFATELSRHEEEMKRLKKRFLLISRLSHPNIVALRDLFKVHRIEIPDVAVREEFAVKSGDFVLVMDCASGQTLSRWSNQFQDGKVPMALVLEVGRQVALALDYAHREQILHRDVKPTNIMVEQDAAEYLNQAEMAINALLQILSTTSMGGEREKLFRRMSEAQEALGRYQTTCHLKAPWTKTKTP